ncbi:MAG: rhomboid family intramembrane serine protease [Nitrososphaeraceae archaeon]|nr:rhomboid family intramembrane serine protease [Nitrososphaeraceae archaeon]
MFPIHDDNQRIHGRPYVNYFLISVNIIIFLWEVIVTDFFSNPDKIAQIFLNYGAVPNSVLEGNFLSLITAMFLHGGVAHLIGNMVFLFIFGDNVEDKLGRIKYLILYIIWGILAGLIHSVYASSIGSGDIPAVGASGAISGVLGAYLIMFPRAKIYTIIAAFIITTVRVPAWAYIPFWFILQIIFNFLNPLGGVAYFAHIGGFLSGLATIFLIKNIMPSFNKRPVSVTRSSDAFNQGIKSFSNIDKPEIFETSDYYEILIDLKGPIVQYPISAIFDKSSRNLKIYSQFDTSIYKIYELPTNVNGNRVIDLSFVNGIARIRLSKL